MPNDQSWNTVAASPAERVAQNINLTATYRSLPTPEIEQVADSTTSITISLTTPSDSDAWYRLESSVDGGPYQLVAELLTAADFPYSRENLPAGSYRHQIKADNPHMGTPFKAVLSAVTLEGEAEVPVDPIITPDSPLARVNVSSGTVTVQESLEHPRPADHSTNLTVERADTEAGPWQTVATNSLFPNKNILLAEGESTLVRLIDPNNGNAIYGPVSVRRPTTGPNQISVTVLSPYQVAINLEQWSGKQVDLRESLDGGTTWHLTSICGGNWPKIIHDVVPGREYTWCVIDRETQSQVTLSSGETIIYGAESNYVTQLMPAAPTHPIADGQIITLTGAGFGAMADARYSGRDDFVYSGLTIGDPIPAVDSGDPGARWESGLGSASAGQARYLLSDHRAVGGRQYGALAQSVKAYMDMLLQNAENAPRSANSLYMSWFFRTNAEMYGSVAGSTGSDKVCRAWQETPDGVPSDQGTRISWTCNQFTFDGSIDYNSIGGVNAPVDDKFRGHPHKYHRLELWVKDSEIHATVDGVDVPDLNGKSFYDTLTYAYPGEDWYTALVGFDISQTGNIDLTFRTGIADVIERPSPMRIEVSELPTWTSSYPNYHRRYEQPVVSWADNEIQFEAFNGNFLPDQDRYVYVIMSDGSVNQNGYPLTGTTLNVGTWSAS